MEQKIIKLDKIEENWAAMAGKLTDQNAIYTIDGFSFVLTRRRYDGFWIAYYNAQASACELHGAYHEDHELFKQVFTCYYGIFDSNCWAKVIPCIARCNSDELINNLRVAQERLSAKKDEIQLGVELELERAWALPIDWLTKRLKTRLGALLDVVCSDGSVRGGTEIRFAHPVLKGWNKTAIEAALGYLKRSRFNHYRGTAGMHIHLSSGSDIYTRKAAGRFMANVPAMQEILYPICARQKKVNGQIKATRYGLGSDITRGYTGHRTLEIRVFEATTNPDVFMGRLKFAEYLMKFLISDMPMSEFFTNMSSEDKQNYKFLVETENPHAFGCGKDAALAKLNIGA